MTWLISPLLTECPVYDVKFYSHFANISRLSQADSGHGLRHKFEFKVATSLTDNGEKLTFNGWMGPEVRNSASRAATDDPFDGMHVFEFADTMEPPATTSCTVANPEARWYAIGLSPKAGEAFSCTRVCRSSTTRCACGRNSHVRCEFHIAMDSSQLFEYTMRRSNASAKGILDGNVHTGSEWEVVAHLHGATDPSTATMTVGRVILGGTSETEGIIDLRQDHEHIGLVPCDRFYESTIATGPFIVEPAGAHAVGSANGDPPALSAESCELFRISSIGGYAVHFETGPGLWPAYEVNDTIFTCAATSDQVACPASGGR